MPACRSSRYATPGAIERAVEAARRAGVDVGGIELYRDGRIRILSIRVALKPPATLLFDRLEREGKL
jgi:hypothetical protein